MDGPITAIAWHPVGDRVVFGCLNQGMRLWDFVISTPQPLGGRSTTMTRLQLTAQGDLLIAGGWTDLTVIWDMRDPKLLLRGNDGFAQALSGDETRIAICRESQGMGLQRWMAPLGLRQWLTPASLEEPVECIVLSRNGKWIATAHHKGWLLWNAETGAIVARRSGEQVQSVSFEWDDASVITCSKEGVLCWALTESGNESAPTVGVPETMEKDGPPILNRTVLSSDGQWMAAAGEERGTLWSMKGPRTVRELPWQGRPAHWPAFSPDSRWLLVGHHHSKEAHVYAVAEGAYRGSIMTGGGRFCFHPAGGVVAASSPEFLSFWSVGTWQELRRVVWPTVSRQQIVAGYSADGRELYVTSATGFLCVRDSESG